MSSIQSSFFEKIRQKIPGYKTPAVELASLLHISKNAAYKRLSGFTSLTLEEAVLLSNHFSISLDGLIAESKSGSAMTETVQDDAWALLEMLEKELDKQNGSDKTTVWAISVDLPLFLYFFSKKLTAFKYNIWQQVKNKTSPFSMQSDETMLYIKRADQVLTKLSRLPINIIMTDRILDGLFHQINEYFELGDHLSEEDINSIFGEVKKVVLILKQLATNRAFSEQSQINLGEMKVRFFINNILETSNLLLVNNGHLFSAFDLNKVPGFVSIDHPSNGLFVKDWLDYLTRHATPISMSNEKERKAFFNKLENKIDLEEVKMLAVVQ